MRLSDRLVQLLQTEHAELRRALSGADVVIRELLDARQRAFQPTKHLDPFERIARSHHTPLSAEERELTSVDPNELSGAWDSYRDAVSLWLDQVSDHVHPQVTRWDADEPDALEHAQQAVAALQSARTQVDSLAAPLRRLARFVQPLQPALHPVFESVEVCRRAEDIEIVPAVLAGSRDTSEHVQVSTSGRYRTADDVARSLRQSIPDRPEPEPEKRGLLQSLRKMWGR